MNLKIAILTTGDSAFFPFANKFEKLLVKKGFAAKIFYKHEDIGTDYEIVFILSYPRLITKPYLDRHKYNLVVHGSDLPKGRGWSPIFWQILEGQDKIPIVLFEAKPDVDSGVVYFKDYLIFQGHELHNEIREIQAEKSIELCLRFLDNYNNLHMTAQVGEPTYYKKRNPKDSELDVNKTIADQFNSLRIASNESYPAFFHYKNHKYILKISKDNNKNANQNKE